MDAAIPERNLYRQAIDCRPWDKVVAFYAACLQCDPKNGGSEMPAFMQGETPVSIQRSYKASAMQTAHVMDATSQQFDPVNVNQEANANVGSHQSNTLLSKAEDDAYNQHLYGITPCDVLKKHWDIKSADAYEPARKHTRTNYCLRLGYVGTSYSGYQRQGGESTPTGGKPDTEEETNHSANSGLHTVEDDILLALGGQTSVAAGRTDKDVSAVSQMICFHTYDDPPRSPEDYLLIAKQSIPCIAGRLRFFDCVTMPRSFHSLFCATWRRYIFLVPLQNYTRCPWIPAPTNASSSCTSTGLSLSESRGVQQVTDPTPLPWLDTATYSKPKYPTWGGEEVPASYDTELGWDIDCAFVDRAARRLEGLTVRCNCFTTSKGKCFHIDGPALRAFCGHSYAVLYVAILRMTMTHMQHVLMTALL